MASCAGGPPEALRARPAALLRPVYCQGVSEPTSSAARRPTSPCRHGGDRACKLEVSLLLCRHDRAALHDATPAPVAPVPRRYGVRAPAVWQDHVHPSGASGLDLPGPGAASDATPLTADPESRLHQLGEHIIFDEAQRVPDRFPVLRSTIDSRRSRKGRVVLLGSASPSLIQDISESLAGRTAFLDLAPFRWDEVAERRNPRGLMTLWFRGGFPEAYLMPDERARWTWLEGYTRAFIERDLAALGIEVSAVQIRMWIAP